MATNTKQNGPKGVRHQRILVLWQFETNTLGVWQNMDRATSDLLEAAFRERPDGEITIHCGGSLSYDYNLIDMWQQRYDGRFTGRDRNILRFELRVRQGECVNR